MEFLTIEKQPIPKDNVLKMPNIEVVLIDRLSNENNEKLKVLDHIWNRQTKNKKIVEQEKYIQLKMLLKPIYK